MPLPVTHHRASVLLGRDEEATARRPSSIHRCSCTAG